MQDTEYIVTVERDAFLAHHGVQGMKWGVHNDETKRKYGELSSGGGAGGGGGGDENQTPEDLLRKGVIDEATAKRMRAQLDELIKKSEDGLLPGGAYEKQVNLVYANAGLDQPYSSQKVATTYEPSTNPLDYNPNTEKGQRHRQSMADWLVDQGVKAAKDAVNQHLDDIQSGNIGQEEARVIGIVNAAAAGVSGSGEGVISNPKAEEMGVKYGQRNKERKHVD